jgi:hypothetical protein
MWQTSQTSTASGCGLALMLRAPCSQVRRCLGVCIVFFSESFACPMSGMPYLQGGGCRACPCTQQLKTPDVVLSSLS